MKTTTVIFFLFVSEFTLAQSNCVRDSIIYRTVYSHKTHNIIGFVPSKARITNGWAIGWSSSVDDYCINMDSVRINGIYTNISVFQPLIAGMIIVQGVFMPSNWKFLFVPDPLNKDLIVKHKLNGVSVGLFDFGEYFLAQGLQLSVLFHKMKKLNGVSLTLITAEYSQLNGLMIAGLSNKTNSGKGLQLGLINNGGDMKGIQIGLWNVNNKRKLPLINWSFN